MQTERQMNRRERRRLNSLVRHVKCDKVTAVHEAGHAVGRYLTADDMGIPLNLAVSRIEIAPKVLSEGDRVVISQACTYGPMFSREIHDIINADPVEAKLDSMPYYVKVFATAAAAGADIIKWVRSKALIAVLGPMSECMVTGRRVDEMFEGPARGDLNDIVRDCTIAGIHDDQIVAIIDEAVERARMLLKKPGVRAAIGALAQGLQLRGTMQGRDGLAIVGRHLALPDVAARQEALT